MMSTPKIITFLPNPIPEKGNLFYQIQYQYFKLCSGLEKKKSNNTYGSYGLREERLNDPLGIKIKFDNLFIKLYDY